MTRTLSEECERPYLDDEEIKHGVKALKEYVKKSAAIHAKKSTKKDLLADDDKAKVLVEVVFKNIPSNTRTYIHTVNLPHHWRLQSEPDECNIALFVKHRKPENEAQALQFERDRDIDLDHSYSYYRRIFNAKLNDRTKSRITKLITTKELATEYNTHKKIQQLSKSYDLFLADKVLMDNKFNSLPRRLGRRFWVKEKKVPLMVRLDAKDLDQRFEHVLKTEPFYVHGRSSTEKIQVGIASQTDAELVENIKAFISKLHKLYGESIRMLRLKSDHGMPLPIYADLSQSCPKVSMKKKKKKSETIIGDFDLAPKGTKVRIRPDGAVELIKSKSEGSTKKTKAAKIKKTKENVNVASRKRKLSVQN